MRRYLARWYSQSDPSLNDVRVLSVSHTGPAARIAERQLNFLRRYAFGGNRWDTWAVLFQWNEDSTPKVMATGHVDV